MQDTGNDNPHSGQSNSIINQLDRLNIEPDINYEADPEYYDKALISFYESILKQGIEKFKLKETKALNRTAWNKLLTNKFIRLDKNSEKAIARELGTDQKYVKDAYFDIALTLYKRRDTIIKKRENIKNWLIQRKRSKEKPFILMYFAGAQIELKESNKDEFINCIKKIETFDWANFKP
jgi:hypothetical protein